MVDSNVLKNVGCDINIIPYPITDGIRFMDFVNFMRNHEDYELEESGHMRYILIKDENPILEYDNDDQFITYVNGKFEHYAIIYDRKRKFKKLDFLYK
jgi:hypothetical protein